MDPLDRADALLSQAQARGAFVVTPDNAVSPMDATSTVQIPRTLVTGAGEDVDPDATTVLSDEQIRENDEQRRPRGRDTGRRRGRIEREDSDAETEEITGLIPTTTRRIKSNLSRRLDG